MEPTSQETRARYELATEWHRKQCPHTQEGESLLAEWQAIEAQHAVERRRWETRFARYLMQVVMPLERKNVA
jgi:hypothetical protein